MRCLGPHIFILLINAKFMAFSTWPFAFVFVNKLIAKLIQSFHFYKFLFGILTNFGKKQVLFHFSFGFLGFFS